MKNISFMLTTEQIRNRTKTVTRRLGWKNLKPGDMLNACIKCMGLKPGEKIEKIAVIRVTDVRRERLYDITADDVKREGFEGKSPEWFIDMFMHEMGVPSSAEVTRIEFEYIDTPPATMGEALADPEFMQAMNKAIKQAREKRPYMNQVNRYCPTCEAIKLQTRGHKYYTCLTCCTRTPRNKQAEHEKKLDLIQKAYE